MEKIINYFVNRSTPAKLQETITITKPVKRLKIWVDVENDEYELTEYLVVRDPKNRIRFQKMIRYGEKTIVIGRHVEKTTIGGVPGPIGAGTWNISLYLCQEYMKQKPEDFSAAIRIQISDKKMDIKEAIGSDLWVDRHYREQLWLGYYNIKKFYRNQKEWYKGNFHTHTHLSVGRETIQNAMKKANDRKMDFYIATEHNVMPTGWEDDSMPVIPGIGIDTSIGHCNLVGIDKMPERLPEIMEYKEKEEVRAYLYEMIREAKRRNWIVGINYPFEENKNWKYGEAELKNIDYIEILKTAVSGNELQLNNQTVRFLDFLWEDGHKIRGVGGSGFDTYVYCEALIPQLLTEGIQKGHMYISRFCTAEFQIRSEEKQYLPGDELEEKTRRVDIGLTLKKIEETPEVVVVKNGEKRITDVWKTEDGWKAEISTEFQSGTWNWLRFEVRNKKGEILLYSNPVYQGKKAEKYRCYQEALDVFQLKV